MKLTYTIPAVAFALSVTAMSLSANTAESQPDTAQYDAPAVSFVKAAELAQATAPGTLVSLELSDDEAKDRLYMAELESATSYSIVLIDAEEGDVELTQIVKASSPELLDAFDDMQGFREDDTLEMELASFAQDLRILQDMCSDSLIDAEEAGLFAEGEDLTAEEIDALGKAICKDVIGAHSGK